MKNISILGGGWLGFPLAKKLAETHRIKISTTTADKISLFNSVGLEPYLFEVPTNGGIPPNNFFENCDLLLITIPPNIKNSEHLDYEKKMDWIISQIEEFKIKEVIFTSSTSVYEGLENEVDENSILKEDNSRAREIIVNELKLLENKNFNATILRLGGLFGELRHPVKFLAKKEVNENGNEPVNMLHLYDAVEAICVLINQPIPNDIFNLVYPKYESREIFYTNAASKLGLHLAEFKKVDFPKNRKVLSTKFQNTFYFTFKHFE